MLPREAPRRPEGLGRREPRRLGQAPGDRRQQHGRLLRSRATGAPTVWKRLAESQAGSLTHRRRGLVASPHAAASEAGRTVLRRGGNAVDAAIAAATTIAVVYPHMNGVGGPRPVSPSVR
ncbi:MAG: gamma-glutamyltransferase [Candidatus Rokubacteria bacterium]|nr:gamma-glutamyltransferase [Candidatus Rokubacteria bacterium]